MGFEQLASFRDQLAQQAAEKNDKQQKSSSDPKIMAKPVDPIVLIIRQLQKQFPNAFPKNPAPKVPLKLGIHNDLFGFSESLGISKVELQKTIKTWCSGNRYWACMVENADRYDLSGNTSGNVTQKEAVQARKSLKDRRLMNKPKPK